MRTYKDLSVKELKHLIDVQAAKLEAQRRLALLRKTTGCEKSDLVKEVQRLVMEDEIEEVLLQPVPAPCDVKEEVRAPPVRGRSARSRMEDKINSEIDPATLKARAKLMRENPQAFRRQNAQLKDKTDADIRKMADELDKTADDPMLFKQMKEGLKATQNMTDEQKNVFTKAANTMNDPITANMDHFDKLVHLKRTDPQAFKGFIKANLKDKGISEDQIDSICDRLDADTINYIFIFLRWLSSTYKTVDEYTYGCGKYIVGALLILIIYLVIKFVWWSCGLGLSIFRYIMGYSGGSNKGTENFTSANSGEKISSYSEDEEF